MKFVGSISDEYVSLFHQYKTAIRARYERVTTVMCVEGYGT